MRPKYNYYIVCLLLFISVTILKADNAEDFGNFGRKLLAERLQPFEKGGDKAVETTIIVEIGFLADVWLGDGDQDYYAGLMERFEKCATSKSIPVLERYIKNAACIKNAQDGRQLPWGVFATIDERIQLLWFRLKTEGMSPEKKAEVALSGFIGEAAQVPIDCGLAERWIVQIGKPARSAFYSFLEQPATGESKYILIGALTGVLTGGYETDLFQPSEKEIRYFIDHDGTFGHLAILAYLREIGRMKEALPGLLLVLQSSDHDLYLSALVDLYYMSQFKEEIVPRIIAEIGKPRADLEGGRSCQSSSYEPKAFRVLAQMGKMPETVTFFKWYMQTFARAEAWGEDFSETSDKDEIYSRVSAIRTVYEALREWGEWPEPQKPPEEKQSTVPEHQESR